MNLTKSPKRHLIAYTDGSLSNGHAGASYHIPESPLTPQINVCFPLGNQMEVYDAELHAITEAAKRLLKLAKTKNLYDKQAWIFTDNQSAITRLSSFKPGPGQASSITVSEIANELRTRRIPLTIQWTPGHQDIPGNKRADELAKHATTLRPPAYATTSLSYIKKQAKAAMTREWHDHWTRKNLSDKAYAGPFRTKPDTVMTTNDRQLVSSAIQLRTGHGYFKDYLSNIPSSDTMDNRCNCPARTQQTAKHLLLHCRLYTEARKDITRGKTGAASRLRLQTLLHTKEGAPGFIEYMKATKIATRRWALGLTHDDNNQTGSSGGGTGWGQVTSVREEHDTQN
jgi:ribonuclease HI